MGGGSYSHEAYEHISSARQNMTSQEVREKVFSSEMKSHMDPRTIKLRESRDSANHPESNAIGVIFDVTGSMGEIPVEFAKHKLGKLMKMLLEGNLIPHPQVCFGAVGDGLNDRAPFQVGQFESDVTMDQVLKDIWIEGNGGGNGGESYAFAPYFFARRTSIDCFEKRGKKGYLFTIGDEPAHRLITRREASNWFGDTLEADLTIEAAIREAQKLYNVFHIVVGRTSHGDNPRTIAGWRELLGDNVIKLDDPSDVSELIGAVVGLSEGQDIETIDAALRAAGATARTITNVNASVAGFRQALARQSPATLTGKLPAAGKSSAARL